MELAAIVERALAVRERYEALERESYGRPWSLEELMLGPVGTMGELDASLTHSLGDV